MNPNCLERTELNNILENIENNRKKVDSIVIETLEIFGLRNKKYAITDKLRRAWN